MRTNVLTRNRFLTPARCILSTLCVIAAAIPVRAACPGFPAWTDITFDKTSHHLAFDGERLWVGTDGGVVEWELQQETFRKFTRANNCLPSNFIQDIAANRLTGDVWAVTASGAAVFNPLTAVDELWTVFDHTNSPLPGNLTAVAIDVDGSVWIGSFDAGLFRFDGASWTQFTTANSGLSDNFVTSIRIASDGTKWIGAWGNGVDRLVGGVWTNFTPGNTGTPPGLCSPVRDDPYSLGLISHFVDVLAIEPDTGTAWFKDDDDSFCLLNGVTSFDGANWATYTADNSPLISSIVNDAAVDFFGNVWFASFAGLQHFDGADWSLVDTSGFLSVTDADHELWVGTAFGVAGIRAPRVIRKQARLNPTVLATDGLVDNVVSAVAVDTPSPGVTWFGSRAAAVRLEDGVFTVFDETNTGLIDANIEEITESPSGNVWFATDSGGVSRFDGTTWVSFTALDGLASNRTTSIAAAPGGDVWVGTSFGASRYDGSTWQTLRTTNSGLPSNSVNDLTVAPNGDVWFATTAGVSRFDGLTWTTYTTADGLPTNATFEVALAPNGDVWAGTLFNGASRFSGGIWTNYTTADGLGNNTVRAFAFESGSNAVWIGTHGGVSIFDGAAFETLTVSDGLINNRVLSIDIDNGGDVWLGTDFGASIFSPAP